MVIDDRSLPRIAAKAMLASSPELEWVGEAATGMEAIRVAARLKPQVVLLDVDLPGVEGPEIAQQLLAENPSLTVLAWTVSDANEDLLRMIKAGCAGYILKDVGPEELRRAIMAAVRGDTPVPRRMLPEVLKLAAEQAPASSAGAAQLTDRERETLQLMVKGMSVKRIAAAMSISPSSVDSHTRSIYKKLHATNRAEAMNAAMRLRLVRVTDL